MDRVKSDMYYDTNKLKELGLEHNDKKHYYSHDIQFY